MKNWLPFVKSDPLVAVVRLSGQIASGARSRNSLSDEALAPVLARAFRKGKPKAVALLINSPGGSPAQSSLIAHRIRRLSQKHDVPVYAFVEDVAASGGYYIAVAADEIYGDANSIVGSIGVISAGFGFSELIERYGIERRVHTSGRSKSMLDPFKPEKDEDVARLRQWQEQIHETFIAHVRDSRGDRLSDNPDLFTGDIWVGQRAVEEGLLDGIAHLEPKMKEYFGDKTRFAVYSQRRGVLGRFGAQITGGVVDHVEERLNWARFGM